MASADGQLGTPVLRYSWTMLPLCGVPSTTSHAAFLAELNMRSLKHFWWQQTIDFWNALASAPASCLHKLVLIDSLQDAFLHGVHNFSWSVSHCLRSVGYHLPTQVQSINTLLS